MVFSNILAEFAVAEKMTDFGRKFAKIRRKRRIIAWNFTKIILAIPEICIENGIKIHPLVLSQS